ncbi:MAG TPA: hypothetical protein VF226_19060 [Hyphomicrobiaceae bacterium]|jgi:hypothetical protein
MRKWMIGVLALAGSAFAVVPGAIAQSEWGDDDADWVWNEFDTRTYYTPPTVGMAPPPATVTPGPQPGMSYFSPPTAAPAPEAPAVGPGQCGTYAFWSETLGRCVDARSR